MVIDYETGDIYGIKEIREYQKEIEELKDENEKLTKEWLKSQKKRRKAIEYATKRQEWLMNCNYSKIGTHNYINFALEIIDILKGSDKE